jgi:shikimate dehydrogenase
MGSHKGKSMSKSGNPRILFIGVTTGASRIMELFPRWAPLLGTSAQLVGVDLPLDASREQYRQVVQTIATHDDILGAVITSHKINLLAAARDLFSDCDRLSRITREANAISKRDGLVAHARDPMAIAATFASLWGTGLWPVPGQHVLCFGAGGAATAIALSLLREISEKDLPPRAVLPAAMHFVDIRAERLAALKGLVHDLGASALSKFHLHQLPNENDALLLDLPTHSLIINATGMGKDLPGAPISRDARFPDGATVWDLNYRGELEFLQVAHEQAHARHLRVYDGWTYFLHGWMQALQPILGFLPDYDLITRHSSRSVLPSSPARAASI